MVGDVGEIIPHPIPQRGGSEPGDGRVVGLGGGFGGSVEVRKGGGAGEVLKILMIAPGARLCRSMRIRGHAVTLPVAWARMLAHRTRGQGRGHRLSALGTSKYQGMALAVPKLAAKMLRL